MGIFGRSATHHSKLSEKISSTNGEQSAECLTCMLITKRLLFDKDFSDHGGFGEMREQECPKKNVLRFFST